MCVLGVGGGGLPGRRGRVKTLTRPGQPGRATAGILRARGVGVLPVRGGGPAGTAVPRLGRALVCLALWARGSGGLGLGLAALAVFGVVSSAGAPLWWAAGSSTGGRLPGRGMAQTPWGRAAALRDGLRRQRALLARLGPDPPLPVDLPACISGAVLSGGPPPIGAPGVAPLRAVPRRLSPERGNASGAGQAAASAAAVPSPPSTCGAAGFGAKRRKDDTAVAGPAEKRASRAAATALIRDPAAWSKAKADFGEALLKPSSRRRQRLRVAGRRGDRRHRETKTETP